jgi:hypothetical protein
VAQVRFQILDANNPPRVRPLEMATRVNRPLRLPLAADDEDGDDVSFVLAQAPSHGGVAPVGTNLVYTPARDFLGVDEFTVRASDGRDTGPEARVSLTVTDKNSAPVAEDSALEVRINTPTPFRLLARDGEGDPLRYVVLTNPAIGTLTGPPPELLYTPATNYTGPDRFSFSVDDGELASEPGTVTIQVVPRNRQPVGRDQSLHLQANQPFVVPFDLADPDDDPLRIAILKGPRHGLIAGLDTNFIYTPRPGFVGPDIFTYKAWDGITYSEARVVFLYVDGQPPVPPRFESILRLDSGSIRLEVRTSPDQTLELQASVDLLNWTTLQTQTRPPDLVVFEDATAPPDQPRFYRVLRR